MGAVQGEAEALSGSGVVSSFTTHERTERLVRDIPPVSQKFDSVPSLTNGVSNILWPLEELW